MGEEDRLKNVVFFTDLDNLGDSLEKFNIQNFSKKNIPVKLHMGEIKNKYYSKPDLVKIIIDELKNQNIVPYLFDTTVAYAGLRHSGLGYKNLAKIHGFTRRKIGCDVIIDDSGVPITIENRKYEVAEHLIK